MPELTWREPNRAAFAARGAGCTRPSALGTGMGDALALISHWGRVPLLRFPLADSLAGVRNLLCLRSSSPWASAARAARRRGRRIKPGGFLAVIRSTRTRWRSQPAASIICPGARRCPNTWARGLPRLARRNLVRPAAWNRSRSVVLPPVQKGDDEDHEQGGDHHPDGDPVEGHSHGGGPPMCFWSIPRYAVAIPQRFETRRVFRLRSTSRALWWTSPMIPAPAAMAGFF